MRKTFPSVPSPSITTALSLIASVAVAVLLTLHFGDNGEPAQADQHSSRGGGG